MKYDMPKEPQVVGGFYEDANLGFNQNLAKLTKFFESKNMDIYNNLGDILRYRNLLNEYSNILFEDCYATGNNKRDMADKLMLEQLIENSREQMLMSEAGPAVIGGLNPIVGLTLPLLKRVWLRTIRRDIIPTVVSKSPVIKGAKETLYMEAPDGTQYLLPDSFYDGSFKTLMNQIKIPLPRTNIALPADDYDLLVGTVGAGTGIDAISTDFFIDTVVVLKDGKTADDVDGKLDFDEGDPVPDEVFVVDSLRIKVNPETKTFNQALNLTDPAAPTGPKVKDYLFGEIDFEKGVITIGSINNRVVAVRVSGYISNENNLYTASAKWKRDYYTVTIGDGLHLNTPLTMERVQDSQVLFDIDETAKAVHTMGLAIEEIKDRDVLDFLDESKKRIAGTKFFLTTNFDCKRPTNYAGLTSEYIRSELKMTVIRFIQKMKEILNIEEVAFVVAGNPADIDYLDDVVWSVQADTVAGGVKLNYSFGVMNRMHNIKIISSTRLDQGTLKIYIHPLETGGEFEQLVYKSYEYSFNVVGNSVYRNPKIPTVPNVMVATRYKNEEFIPAQGEIRILNSDISMSEIGIK